MQFFFAEAMIKALFYCGRLIPEQLVKYGYDILITRIYHIQYVISYPGSIIFHGSEFTQIRPHHI